MPLLRVAVLLSALSLVACAQTPATPVPLPSLAGTEWLLEDLGGNGVLDRAQATLAFPKPDRVAGQSSCNRFFGSADIQGETIKLGKLATTRMACLSPAVSNQEAKYLKALQNAERITMDGPYLLVYSNGLDKPLRYTKMQKTQKP